MSLTTTEATLIGLLVHNTFTVSDSSWHVILQHTRDIDSDVVVQVKNRGVLKIDFTIIYVKHIYTGTGWFRCSIFYNYVAVANRNKIFLFK